MTKLCGTATRATVSTVVPPYAALLAASNDAFATVRADGTVLWSTAKFRMLLGAVRTVGCRLAELVVPGDTGALCAALDGCVVRGVARLDTITAVGRHLRFDFTRVSSDDTFGGEIAVVVSNRTELVRVTAERDGHSALRHFLADHAADVLIRCDTDKVITYVSPAIEPLLGLTDRDVTGVALHLLIGPEHHRAMDDAFTTATDEATKVSIEVEACGADVRSVWVELSVKPVLSHLGGIDFHVALRDVTERRAAHLELARQRAFIDACLADLQTGVMALDAEERIVTFNEACADLHGFCPLPGASLRDITDHLQLSCAGAPLPFEQRPLIRALRTGATTTAELVMHHPDGRQLTVISKAAPLTDTDGNISGAVLTIHDVSELSAAKSALERLAVCDTLTGLANRHGLVQALELLDVDAAVLFCDLDGFKAVNDTLGHAAGDELLIEVAHRLRHVVRGGDLVARPGGDEFIVLLPCCQLADAVDVAERIELALAVPVVCSSGVTQIGVSIGVAVRDAGEGPESLLSRADAAMYSTKRRHHTLSDTAVSGT